MRAHLIQDRRLTPMSSVEALSLLIRPPGRPTATMWTLEIVGGERWTRLLVLVGVATRDPQPDGWGVQYQVLYADGAAHAEAAFVGLFTLTTGGEHPGGQHQAVRRDIARLSEGASVWRWVVLS